MNRSAFTRLFTLALFICLPLLMDSCSKNNDAAPATAAGSWKFTSISISPAYGGITDYMAFLKAIGDTCFSDLIVTFKSDGTVTTNTPKTCANDDLAQSFVSSKWVVNGSKMTVTDNTNLQTPFDYALNGNEMSLSVVEPDVDPTTGKTVNYTLTMKLQRQ